MSKKELIGKIDVDAGLVMIGDPCYTSSGRNVADDWERFCDKLQREEVDGVTTIEHESGLPGKALVVGDFGGDGTYPVYVKRDKDGQVKKIIIDFEQEDE